MRRTVQIDAAQTVLLDALQGETFLVNLITSIKNFQIKNASPGQLYVFIFTQNQAGGHTVAWGSQMLNASTVNPQPHSVTVQSFIGDTGGTLRSNIPAGFA